ncbi:MAG: hypothetical protein IKP83_02010 [Bacteroidales bacterium]|nr:hypothetical protein [Bacteroidales bacterium]
MKTSFTLFAAAMAMMTAFTACNPEKFVKEVIDENDGEMTLSASNASAGDQAYSDGNAISFQAVLCDADSGKNSIRFVGMANKLTERVEGNTYPIFGMNLLDTANTSFTINFPINDPDFLLALDWTTLLTGDNSMNIMVVATSNDAYYVATEGTITISSLGQVGAQVTGSINGVTCKYITNSKIEYIRGLKERIARGAANPSEYGADAQAAAAELGAINWETYFPSLVLTGNYSSLRAGLSRYLNAINAVE